MSDYMYFVSHYDYDDTCIVPLTHSNYYNEHMFQSIISKAYDEAYDISQIERNEQNEKYIKTGRNFLVREKPYRHHIYKNLIKILCEDYGFVRVKVLNFNDNYKSVELVEEL